MGLRMWSQQSLKLIKPGGGKGSITLGMASEKFQISPLTKSLREKLRRTRAYGQILLKQKQAKLDDLSLIHI